MVAFLGNVHSSHALNLVRGSHVAVIPHLVSGMPSKMFFYMHCGMPIVASDFPGIRRVLNETKCGILFRPGDTKELANVLRRVLVDDALRYQLSSNAERAAGQRYNWENESQKLIDLYSSLQM
jgi:glycosyltransferase involved in cell wall biosynthesis